MYQYCNGNGSTNTQTEKKKKSVDQSSVLIVLKKKSVQL